MTSSALNDLIIQPHGQDDDISTIMMRDIYSERVGEQKTTRPAAMKRDNGHSTDSTEEIQPDTSSIIFKRTQYYRYAIVFALLLLLITCGLGFVYEKLVVSGHDTSSDDRRSDDNIMETGWALRAARLLLL